MLGPAVVGASCPLPAGFQPTGRVERGDVVVFYRPTPAPIEIGRHFGIDVVVCAGAPPVTGLRVDAGMPEHRHGMNYRASVQPAGPGRYRAEGLLFHMPGRWQLQFDVERGGRSERLESDLTLE